MTNTLATVPLLREAEMAACVFHELIGFAGLNADEQVANARRAIESLAVDDDIRFSLAPHAPYSVSPALFSAIRHDLDDHGGVVSTVHLGESPEEVEFLKKGTGPWRMLLEELGVWKRRWQAPQSSPVEYLADMGFPGATRCSRCTACSWKARPGSAAGAWRHARVVPAQQSIRRRRLTSARGVLRDGRGGGIRHRQSGQRGRPQHVRRAGRGAALPRRCRARRSFGARRWRAPRRLDSVMTSAASNPVSVRPSSPCACRRVTDVEEYLVSGIEPSAIEWLIDSNSQFPTRPSMGKLATYLSFVRFSHSVFALPFALTGALLAWREQPFSWSQVAWIVVCMVSARSAAMGFNRLVDAGWTRSIRARRCASCRAACCRSQRRRCS